MSCNARQLWEDVYALEVFKKTVPLSVITENHPFFQRIVGTTGCNTRGIAGTFGATAGNVANVKYNCIPADHPVLKAQLGIIKKELAMGKSIENISAYTTITAKPEPVSMAFVATSHNVSTFAKLLFQSGATIAPTGTVNNTLEIMTCKPYADSCPVQYGNLVRFMQAAGSTADVDQVETGVIVSSLNLKGEEGGLIEGTVEFTPANWSQYSLAEENTAGGGTAGVTGTKLTAAMNFDATKPFKFEDCLIFLDGDRISVPKFDITIKNNPLTKFYNEVYAKQSILGKFEASGTISIPWNETFGPTGQGGNQQIKDFQNNVDKVLQIVIGGCTGSEAPTAAYAYGVDCGIGTTGYGFAKNQTVDTKNYMAITANIKITDYNQSDIDGLIMNDITFMALQDDTDTVNTFTLTAGYDRTKNSWVGEE